MSQTDHKLGLALSPLIAQITSNLPGGQFPVLTNNLLFDEHLITIPSENANVTQLHFPTNQTGLNNFNTSQNYVSDKINLFITIPGFPSIRNVILPETAILADLFREIRGYPRTYSML